MSSVLYILDIYYCNEKRGKRDLLFYGYIPAVRKSRLLVKSISLINFDKMQIKFKQKLTLNMKRKEKFASGDLLFVLYTCLIVPLDLYQ